MPDSTLLMQIFGIANAAVFGAVVVLLIQFIRSHSRKDKPSPETSKAVTPQKEAERLAFDADTKKRIIKEAEASFQDALDKSVASLEEELAETTAQIRAELERVGKETEGASEVGYETLSDLQTQVQTIINTTQATLASHQTGLTKKLTDRQTELEAQLVKKVSDLEEQLAARQLQLQSELNERQAELEAALARRHAEVRTGLKERQERMEADIVHHQSELESALKERESSLAKIQTEIDTELASRRRELQEKLDQEIQAKRDFLARQLDTKLTDAVNAFLLESLQHNVDLGAQASYLTSLLDEHRDELINEVKNA